MARRFDVEISIALGADITANPATWSWTDITSYCMVREGGVTIRRGRGDWQAASTPSTCSLLLNNVDGRFARLNPTGPYYGQLTKNTPLRVRARPVAGSYSTRFVGFVSEWPIGWDPSEKHFWVSATSAGSLRRIGLTTRPLDSPLRRSLSRSEIVSSYWPLEDAAGSTIAASGLANGQPLTVIGTTPGFAQSTGPAGSANLLDLATGGGLTGHAAVPSDTPAAMRLQFLLKFPTGGAASVKRALLYWTTTSGTYTVWWFGVNASNELYVEGYTPTGSLGVDMSPFPTTGMYDGQWHRVEIGQRYNEISHALITYLQIDSANRGTGPTSLGAGETFGPIDTITINPFAGGYSGSYMPAIGHLTVVTKDTNFSAPDPLAANPALDGYAGEMAHARVQRLLEEEGIPVSVNATVSQAMGPQPVATLLDILRECETADAGLLIERKTGELGYDSHTDRENLTVGLALDYDQGHVGAPDFAPVDDDRATRNDVTVSRPSGSSARVEQTEGPMGTNPITGAGRYEESITANVATDDQLLHLAGWRVNLTQDPYLERLLAQHEATHAVLALRLGGEVHSSELRDDGVGVTPTRCHDNWKDALVFMAPDQPSSHDVSQAKEVLGDDPDGERLDLARATAMVLARGEEAAIQRVAEALLARRFLTGEEVIALAGERPPDIAAEARPVWET